jgi:putative Holliday junction resolvase
MRVVGVDVGRRRIGIAVSDASATLARPLTCIAVTALDRVAVERVRAEIGRLQAEDDGVVTLVIGLPRRLNGEASDMTVDVERFAHRLGDACALPVVLQDERLSSHEAEGRLAVRHKDWRARKALLDAAAAAVILQDYLDARPSAVPAAEGDDW